VGAWDLERKKGEKTGENHDSAVPPHLQAMILVSKLPHQMSTLVQSICQTDNIEDLKTDDIKRKAILAWEQRGPTQTQNNRPFNQPQAAKKISAIQRSGPPPSFQQQQQQPQQEEQHQGNQNPQRGGWRGGRGGRGGTFRGTHAGKNKQQNQQQQAARPIEERAPSPAPSFVFGKIASPVVVPDLPRSVYPNFTNALSLAHRIGAKPTIETVKRLEVIERAKEEQKSQKEQRSLSRPNKCPRVRRDDEVSLYWSSDDDDVEMFLDNSAGPSSRCAKIASPLDATNLFPSGYNTLLATIETTSIVPYVDNTICCRPNVISDFVAEDHMNRVDWILDSGASLHFTGDMNDFVEYTPLEKNITANTATSANTQIIGKGTVMMAVEGSEHMVRIAPVFYVPDLSMRLLSLGVFLRGGLQLNGNTERISLLQDGQEFLTFLPRWDGATIFIIHTYLGAKPSIRAAEQIYHPDFETYHQRFAHPSNDVLHKIGKYTYGLPSQIQIPENHICPGCEQGKKTNKSFLSTKTRASKPFELVHSDLKSFPVESYHKYKYAIVFLDDFSSNAWTINLHTKDAALPATKRFIAMVKNQFNTNIVEWMSDAGGEYKSKAFLDMLGNEGIKVSQSIPYVHQQNGRAERLIRTLTEKAKTMRFQACLPPSWWEFSLDHAVHVYNRTPMRRLEWRTPHEWFTGERPSIKRLRVLGCGAYVFIPSEIRENKMAPKAELMVFLGMHSGGKGYIFMRGPNNIIFSAAHATFDESLFPRCPKKTLQNNTRLQEVAPPVAPCGGDNCHCPPPDMEDDDDTSHLFSRTSKKVIYDAQKELDQRLRNVDITPSQRHGMRMPPPRTSASQDRLLLLRTSSANKCS